MKIDPNFYWVNPAAGVNASANDMAKYLIAMLGHQPGVFSAEALAQLQQPLVKLRGKSRWPVWQQFKQVSNWYGRGWRVINTMSTNCFITVVWWTVSGLI